MKTVKQTTIMIITVLLSLACLSTAAIAQPSTTSYKKAPRLAAVGADFAKVSEAIPTPQTLTVCAEILNVRTGAGTRYTVTDHLFKGETITVQGRTASGWVRIANNQYVNGDFLCEVKP